MTAPPESLYPRSGNPSVQFALVMLETRYPSPPYIVRLEEPKVVLKREHASYPGVLNGFLRPDIAIYRDEKLVAVIEVGELTRDDKLRLLEQYLPDVAVWWIPKSDILCARDPEMSRYRFNVDIDALVVEGNRLLSAMQKQREEYVRQEKEFFERVKAFDEAISLLQEIPKLLSRTARMFERVAKSIRQPSGDQRP